MVSWDTSLCPRHKLSHLAWAGTGALGCGVLGCQPGAGNTLPATATAKQWQGIEGEDGLVSFHRSTDIR